MMGLGIAGLLPGLTAPWVLLAFPLPLLVARLLRPVANDAVAVQVPASVLRPAGGTSRATAAPARRARLWLGWAAWVALLVALAGPCVVAGSSAALPMSGRDIVLALDVSGSMESRDFILDGAPVRRIDAVKAVVRDFLRRRAGDRVGLVFFAEQAEVAVVPTFDLSAVEGVLMETEIGMLGRSTAIGDGLGLALKRLTASTSPSRTVVLLSDGVNTAGVVGAAAAADLARTLGIRVHTIALGTDDPASPSEAVDTPALEHIAQASGGRAFRVRTLADLQAVATEIDALEPVAFAGAPMSVVDELWPYPAVAALVLCLAAFQMGRRPA